MGLLAYFIILGISVCAAASFFFALAETAIFALGKSRARQMADAQRPGADRLVRLLERPVDLLATIVLGNTIANAAIVALALAPVLRGDWPLGQTLLGVLLTIVFLCEVFPKTLAIRAPERWAVWVGRPMIWLETGSRSIQRVFQGVNERILAFAVPKSIKPQNTLTDEDYHELLDMAFQQGALAQREKEIILQIIGLDQKTARDVMRPRTGMAAIPDDLSVAEMIEAARVSKRRRLPIYDQTPDTIVGILDTQKLLLDPEADLAEAIEFPSFVPESMNLLKLLQSLQRQQRGLAVVAG
jgi:putative hemolysin